MEYPTSNNHSENDILHLCLDYIIIRLIDCS